jgi:hypothetical protein
LQSTVVAATATGAAPCTITITGADKSALFPVGAVFSWQATGEVLEANKAVTSCAYTGGDTVITTVSTITHTGAGEITQGYNWITLDGFFKLTPTYNQPAVYVTDRLGFIHRIGPVLAASKQRGVIGVQLVCIPNDALIVAANGTAFPTLLEDYAVDADTQFIIFNEEIHVDLSSAAYTRYSAYKCKLDDIPGVLFGTLTAIDGNAEPITLQFNCHSNGTYATFNNPASGTYVTRPT